MRQTPPLVFEATGGWWWPLEDKTNPLLVFEATEGGWWLLVDEMKPLLAFEAMEGWWSLLVDETSLLLVFEAMEGSGGCQWTRQTPHSHLRWWGGWWWPLEDETNPCSRLRQQGVVVAVRGQDEPPPRV
jgi:hypothetical protein